MEDSKKPTLKEVLEKEKTRFFDEPSGECRKSAESAGKVRLDLVPTAAIEQVAAVLTFGARKYGDNNWCRGARWGRYYAAALRHVFAWWRGEDRDLETGLSHLAHAVCCLLFLMEYQDNGWGADDRLRESDGGEFKKADGEEPRTVLSSQAEGNISRKCAAKVIAKFKDDRELRRYVGL